MKQIFLIGGGAASGKSSVAKKIGNEYGIDVLKADILEGDHRKKAAMQQYPVNSYLNTLPEEVRRLELIRFSAKQERARHEELFFMLLKELRERDFEKLIIEGNSLIPRLIRERFEFPYQAVFLFPTLRFQSEQFLEREWARKLVTQAKDPTLLLHTWAHRDHQLNQELEHEARDQGFPVLTVDGSKGLDHSVKWAKKHLNLK